MGSQEAPSPSKPEAIAPETLDDLLVLWDQWNERRTGPKGISAHSLRIYRTAVRHWRAEDIAHCDLHRLTAPAVEDTVVMWLNAGLSQNSVLGYLSVLASTIRYGRRRGWAPDVELRTARTIARGKGVQRVYEGRTPTPGEVAQVLQHVTNEAHRLALWLQAVTGARISEICALRPEDYDRSTRTLKLEGHDEERGLRGKTGARHVYVDGELARTLDVKCQARSGERYLVDLPSSGANTVMNSLAPACERAGVERFTTHGLRRMVTNRMLRAGVDLTVASRHSGHSIQTMLTFYRDLQAEEARAQVAEAGIFSLPSGDVVKFPDGAQKTGTTRGDAE